MIAQLVQADQDTVRDVIHKKKGIRWGGGPLLAAA